MDKKKVVIISRAIFPMNAPRALRATELAKELARQGHSVTLYGVLGSYDYQTFEEEYNLKVVNLGKMIFAKLNSDGIDKTSTTTKLFSRVFNRLLEFPDIELMLRVYNVVKKLQNVDLLITIAIPYPIHWGAALAKSKNVDNFPKTWVADCGDPYMGNEFKKRLFYFRYIEKWFCRAVDFITVPVKEAVSAYYSEFHKKIVVIPQGFALPENTNVTVPNNSIPTFIYAGTLYQNHRNPSKFLKYLCSVEREFKFIIFTKSKKIVAPFVPLLDKKLEIKDYIPREELLKEMSRADFLVNFENESGSQVPSKLIDYLIAGRPVISIDTQNFNRTVVDNFLVGDYTGQLELPDIHQYDITNIVNKFLLLTQKSYTDNLSA